MNRCTFTQTTKFTSLILPHDEHFEQIQCENMTEEQFDEYGRAYCKEHRNKVDEINKLRHKNCINKEKLKYFLLEYYNTFKKGNQPWFQTKVDTYSNLFEKIENGEFN